MVEVARGLWGALIKYLNAVHGLELDSPFAKLAAVGLMPERAQPRARVLQERDLPAWRAALSRSRQRALLAITARKSVQNDPANPAFNSTLRVAARPSAG